MRTTQQSLEALDRLERARAVRAREGWSPGRVLAHCAQSIECSLSGYPQPRSALFQATAGRIAMRLFLARGSFQHDIEAAIPSAPDCGEPTLAEGLARMRAALSAFSAAPAPLAPHFAYGAASHAQYEALHAMHLTDHLAHLDVEG